MERGRSWMYRRSVLKVRGLSSEFVNGDMLKSGDTPLYEEFTWISQLSATAELLNIKSENNWSKKLFDQGRKTRLLDSAGTSTSADSEPIMSRTQKTRSRDEAARVLARIWRVLAHSLSGKLQSIDCSRLTSLTRSLTKTFMFIEKDTRRSASSSMSKLTILDKFSKLKEQKEHKRRTTGALVPTDHKLMLELNEGLKKGHAYGFGAAESARLHTQPQHAAIGGRPFLGGYEEHMTVISHQMLPIEPPPEWQMPDCEVGKMSDHGDHDGEDENTGDEEIPPSS
ncbi:hypothetical protein M9H77_29662 [Catharanthus roseus]|uniref:Uncharacterized protein n=1 Tax=Catharanthus roseus TaxID=4058 RepID=A0ACB9ZWX6_CATRO|nr:hypothetical protein M9H77_29662 [Catharanthus roseus]